MTAAQAIPILVEWCSVTGFPGSLAASIVAAESGFDLDQTRGDGGQSVGGLSIHLPAHGGPAEKWLGPDGLRRSLAEMGGRWLQALAERGGRLAWDTRDQSKAAFFMDYWPRAQGADASQITLQQCREAVAAGVAAWAEYGTTTPEETASMVTKPPVVWVGAHASNYAVDRIAPNGRRIAPEAWVNHIAEGTFAGLASWFNLPADQHIGANGVLLGPSSTHYSVAKDGRAQQHVLVVNTAFGNGGIETGYTAALIDENDRINPNLWSVSCEHEGRSGEAPTQAMFDTSTRLCAATFAETLLVSDASGVAIDRKHILRHGDISPFSRRGCPGSGWSDSVFEEYIAAVANLVAGVAGDHRDEQITQLKAALAITVQAVDAEALNQEGSARRLRSAAQGARDALQKWG